MPILHWLTREHDLHLSGKAPYRLLEHVETYGDENNENMLIQGDNLDALKALLPYYAGKVKCIYIDPPYNTKNAFEHYDDNLEHSIWLSIMYPRLEFLKELLTEDGLLAIQIDDNEFARLYLILCELFSESKIKVICVKMSEATGVKMASVNKAKSIAKIKEYIILIKKDGIKNLNLERIPKEKWDNEYKTYCSNISDEDLEKIKVILLDEERNQKDIEFVDNAVKNIHFSNVNDVAKQETGGRATEDWCFRNAHRIVQFATLTGGARELAINKKEQYNELPSVFSIQTRQNKMYLIKADFNTNTSLSRCKLLFADQYLTIHAGDLWTDIKTTGLDNEGGIDFKNSKKPEKLVQRIISMSTKQGDLVLDSFLGSGTTAAVAHKMGRRYIGIELGNHCLTHCIPRLEKVIGGEQGGVSKSNNWQGGGGFRFYKLGEPIFEEDGSIRDGISFAHLAAHIWFAETGLPMQENANSPCLGIHEGTAYYLLYNGILKDKSVNGGNVLTKALLQELQVYEGKKVIYGERSLLSAQRLKEMNIEFKQTPYDIKGR